MPLTAEDWKKRAEDPWLACQSATYSIKVRDVQYCWPYEIPQRQEDTTNKLIPASETPNAILNILTPDVLLCVTDHLWFPDIFALAMTCKAFNASLPLKEMKQSYAQALVKGNRGHSSRNRRFCRVCLYAFPASKIDYSLLSPRDLGPDFSLGLCQQCKDFRERMSTAEKHGGGSEALPSPIWRPSRRVYITRDESLWYRSRSLELDGIDRF